MSQEIALVDSPIEQALTDARKMIAKVQVAMVKIYYVFAKEEIQKGMKQLPPFIRDVLRTGVNTVVAAIKKIVNAMTEIHDKGYVLIALLKEVPNLVEATVDLLDEAAAKSARTTAKIMAFTAVFVEEKFADVQLMLLLFTKLLDAVSGEVDKDYKPGVVLKLSVAQLGFDPAVGPDLSNVKALSDSDTSNANALPASDPSKVKPPSA
jgi:hypothetical protein